MEKSKRIGIGALLAVMLLVSSVLVVSASISGFPGESVSMDNEKRPVLEFWAFTQMVASGVSSKSELGAQGILKPEELTVPVSVKRFDLVIFNLTGLSNQIRSGSLSIRIRGELYDAELKRVKVNIVDSGIYSYKGTLKGVKDSRILLTISDKVVIAEINVKGESIWIKPVEPRKQVKSGKPVLHIVYSSKDTKLPMRPVKIDNGPVKLLNQTSAKYIKGMGVTARSGTIPIGLLVATDNKFYEDESDWKATAQDIIAEANNQFNRDDIDLHLFVMDYDDSKRYDLSNDPDIKSDPLGTFKEHFPASYLNSKSADLAIYLGGYDADGNGIGQAVAYPGGRHAWAQMASDWLHGYSGSEHGRKAVTIHELGHNFDAGHEDSGGYNQAYYWWSWGSHYTVMWSGYSLTGTDEYEFSSDNYHGDSTHDNARRIRETKATVAGYI